MGRHNGPPTRWTEYSSVHDIVPGTRFIPFKTPYKFKVNDEKFNVLDLIRKVPNLGLVVNLVNTDRYYNKGEFSSYHIEVKHERMLGHGTLPTEESMESVFTAIEGFMSRTKDDETKLIGVHCTHGVNRTGFLICSYMILKLGFEPHEAIDRFVKARKEKFDREYYVEELLKMTPSVDEQAKEYHSKPVEILKRNIGERDDMDFSLDDVLDMDTPRHPSAEDTPVKPKIRHRHRARNRREGGAQSGRDEHSSRPRLHGTQRRLDKRRRYTNNGYRYDRRTEIPVDPRYQEYFGNPQHDRGSNPEFRMNPQHEDYFRGRYS